MQNALDALDAERRFRGGRMRVLGDRILVAPIEGRRVDVIDPGRGVNDMTALPQYEVAGEVRYRRSAPANDAVLTRPRRQRRP